MSLQSRSWERKRIFSGQFNWEEGTEKPRFPCETWKWVQGLDKIAGVLPCALCCCFQVFKVINPVRWSYKSLFCFFKLFLGSKLLTLKVHRGKNYIRKGH